MATITLSDEQFSFIKNLIQEIETQDNAGTAKPYFYVAQELEQRSVSKDYSYDEVKYHYENDVFTQDEILDSLDCNDLDDLFEKYGDEIYEVYIKKEYTEGYL